MAVVGVGVFCLLLGAVGAVMLFGGDDELAADSRDRASADRDDRQFRSGDDEGDEGDDSGRDTTTTTTSTSTTTTVATTTTTLDQQDAARAEIETMVADGRRRAPSTIFDRWAPQVSTRYLGLTDPVTGITYNTYESVRDYFRELERQFGDVLVLSTNDYSTYSTGGMWVVLVNETFDSPEAVHSWCRREGLGRDDCIAKVVSVTAALEGSTRMQPEP